MLFHEFNANICNWIHIICHALKARHMQAFNAAESSWVKMYITTSLKKFPKNSGSLQMSICINIIVHFDHYLLQNKALGTVSSKKPLVLSHAQSPKI